MDKYLSRHSQPARATSQAKHRQPAPAPRLPTNMAPARDTTPEVPETPQGPQEPQHLLDEDDANLTRSVAPQSLSARDNSQAAKSSPSRPGARVGAATAEGEQQNMSDTTKQLIHYTGSEARRQIAFTRGQMQKAPVLNPLLLEMEKLRDHRPVRGELPYNWQHARREGGAPAQPAATASEDNGTKLIEAQSSHRAVHRSALKARPQHPSTASAAARAQYRELEDLVPAPNAPIFSSVISQKTSSRNTVNKSLPRSTRPTWNFENMATGARSTEAETASILVGMQFTPAINEAMPYGELKYRLESHSPDTREGPRRKKRKVEAVKENEKIVIDLTMED
ncbi:hypothetical protein CBER1_08623 [Cercospora berteroae]|uniref:Uncharacterized protein n=1 Tax=Cercospora berteroae TaxID=357750 RepID=A0A2S6BV23_9PEZI|nr:hypothetical protein CBER1_08623 [Cercospora berteroae]